VVRARQRESEAQLKIGEVNKLEAIGRLSAGIAHDFNNLLATIIGSAELGQSNIRKGQSPEDELERIELAGRRGAELIRKLLSFAQPGSLFPESFDLVQHFRSVAPALPGNSGDSAVLKIQLPTSPIWIRSRPIDVEQVVFNLLQNALEASAPSSPIEFSIERAPPPAGLDAAEAVRIRVRDQGCGMTEDTLARIFDPFFTTRSDSGGNGLGLAVSYGLIQSGGGTIEVRSVPDHGSCFDVWFSEVPTPIQRTVKSAPPPTEAVSEEPRALQTQRRVLVVEDNRDVREVVVALLQDHGFRVESSPSGAAAMKTLEEIGDFAVLVSDVVMPELGGIELLRELRARGNDLPVLLMSGFSPQDLEGQDHLQPFVMLAKPFSRRALLDSIDSLTGLVDSASSGVL
jgi:CheY-like chemotaxis protein